MIGKIYPIDLGSVINIMRDININNFKYEKT